MIGPLSYMYVGMLNFRSEAPSCRLALTVVGTSTLYLKVALQL